MTVAASGDCQLRGNSAQSWGGALHLQVLIGSLTTYPNTAQCMGGRRGAQRASGACSLSLSLSLAAAEQHPAQARSILPGTEPSENNSKGP